MTIYPKHELRTHYKAIRKRAFNNDHKDTNTTMDSMASRQIAAKILELKALRDAKIVASYMPIHSEIDGHLILKALHVVQYQCCLPFIAQDTPENTQDMCFKQWDLKAPLQEGRHSILQPHQDNPILVPDMIIVPLIAFDQEGYRLGYGGGYYDRCLRELKKSNPALITIGVAYQDQYCDALPHESHDIPLDMVITEQKTYLCNQDLTL